jgi:Family of unknown function (DUF6174)
LIGRMISEPSLSPRSRFLDPAGSGARLFAAATISIMSYFKNAPYVVMIGLIPLIATMAGCGGEQATRQSIKDARARWDKAGIRNYDFEWECTGPSQSHYVVSVRDGQVRSVEGIAADGKRFAAKPADTTLYSVDGLFTTVAEELAQLDTDTPFGQPKGTEAVLRFTTDPTDGYLKTYRRDVMGAPRALTIDVVRFTRVEPGASTK